MGRLAIPICWAVFLLGVEVLCCFNPDARYVLELALPAMVLVAALLISRTRLPEYATSARGGGSNEDGAGVLKKAAGGVVR